MFDTKLQLTTQNQSWPPVIICAPKLYRNQFAIAVPSAKPQPCLGP